MRALIAILPGDGIGPEVTHQAMRILTSIAERFGHTFEFREAPIGGAAIDRTGRALPDQTLALCRRADAVLLGAVGGPAWSDPDAKVRPEQGLLQLRRALGLFANLRPVRVHPALAERSPLRTERLVGVDILFVRELAGGIYFGGRPRVQVDATTQAAADLCTYNNHEIERVVRVAATLARRRSSRLVSVDKANVLETSRLWRSVTSSLLAREFPDITLEHVLVDAFAMHLLHSPSAFDVVVTENMFGDILTDEAAALAGSIGVLPSASLAGTPQADRQEFGLYEPIHGSAPDLAGRDAANPIGAILSAAMMLRYSLGLEREAEAVERAVEQAIGDGVRTADMAGPFEPVTGTEGAGAAIANALETAFEQRIAEGVA